MSLDQLIDDVLEKEGGFVNDPDDRGGATHYGITAQVYLNWLVRHMTEADAREIYRQEYLVGPGIHDLPEGIRPVVFDSLVNHGTNKKGQWRGIVWLQEAIRVRKDGIIGPKTLAAAYASNVKTVVNDICGIRLEFYRSIARNDSSQIKFLNGWIKRAESFRIT